MVENLGSAVFLEFCYSLLFSYCLRVVPCCVLLVYLLFLVIYLLVVYLLWLWLFAVQDG